MSRLLSGGGRGGAGKYESAEELEGLLKAGEADSWLSLGLAAVLNVLPLSAQLATVSGSLWSAVLQVPLPDFPF